MVLAQNSAIPQGLQSSKSIFSSAYVFFGLGLLLAIGGFNLQLSGVDTRETLSADAASLLSQVLFTSVYFIATLVLLSTSAGRKILARAWPIFVLPVLALISAAWAPDAALTLRRAAAFLGTVLFGVSLGSYFSFRDTVCLVARVLAVAMVLSVIWVLVFPAYGIHQAYEAYPFQPVHAGYWRGIFAHRNVLGSFVGGLTFGLLVVFGRHAFKSWILRYGAIAATFACLIGANSGTGYVLAGIIPTTLLSLSFIARQKANLRLPLIVMLIFVIAFFSIFIEDLLALGLWILNKSPDLTGRVTYWNFVVPLMDDSPLLGYGYFSGFALLIGPKITSLTDYTAIAPHNGLLDLLVAFGYVGVIIGIVVLLWALWRGIRIILIRPAQMADFAAFPLCIVVFALVHNTVESTLMLANNIVVVLLATAIGMLARADLVHSRSEVPHDFRDNRALSGLNQGRR